MTLIRFMVLASFLSAIPLVLAEDVGSAFTYQGELQEAGVPADGTFDFKFDLFNVATSGSPIASTVLLDDIVVVEGIFSVVLDFGLAAVGDEKLFLEISVRDGADSGDYTFMSPRQVITPAPFALQAQSVPDGSISAAQIDAASVQARVSGTCAVENAVRVINQDGSVVCEPIADTGCNLDSCDGLRDTATLTCGETSTLVSCITPGKFWTSHPDVADEALDWTSVTYGDGLFVAVSTFGPNGIMSSPDGFNWTPRGANPPAEWRDVGFGGDLFVAVNYAAGGQSQIITSPDGINWTPRDPPVGNWQSVIYGDGLWVAVSFDENNQVITSPDGINWTSRNPPGDNQLVSVTYGNGLFVATGGVEIGPTSVMTSPDGITWTPRATPDPANWSSVTFGDGLFVAGRFGFDNIAQPIMTSPDGINWTLRDLPQPTHGLRDLTFGDGLFVGVGGSGPHQVMTSPDGINWTLPVAAEAIQWQAVTYGDGLFVAVGAASGDVNRVMTSQ